MSTIDKPILALGIHPKLKVVRRSISAKKARPPFKMPVVRRPRLRKHTVDIREYGAVSDRDTVCTDAIAQAIEDCAKSGGGRVLIPAGNWLSGQIHLQSNIDLHIAHEATLRFTDEPQHYLPPVWVRWGGIECYNYSPFIYARDCRNIAITGNGKLLGQGKTWWPWKEGEGASRARLKQMVEDKIPVQERVFGCEDLRLRPQLICLMNCGNVLLENFTIAEGGPYWAVQLAYCQNVTVRGLDLCTPDGPNNEGIVIDSSRNVIVEDCDLKTHDDCIVLKSGLNEDGWRVDRPTENIIIRHIRATGGVGGIAIGSEIASPIRNVFVHDCHYDGVSAGIRIKVPRGRGGPVEDIFIQDIRMGNIPGDAIQMTTHETASAKAEGKPPTLRNIRIRNITCEQANTAVRMIGLADAPFREIMLENITISSEEGLFCVASKGLRLLNMRITPRNGPVLSVRDSQHVVIDGFNNVFSRGVFLDLRGGQVHDVRLRGESDTAHRPTIVLGIDVPKDAIVQE